MATVELIATAPMGLESVVAHEVKQLGYTDMTVENGKVTFRADPSAIARTNLWLRSADRVLIQMGEFTATTFEELFEQTKALPWPDWIPADATFPVNGRSHHSQLSSVPACQAIVKKAIVESMKARYGIEWFQETGPKHVIEVALLKDKATLTLDTTGPGLHKRGYRKQAGPAPLKETLACAMLSIARWYWDRPLYDPFCGSGTILIEAALMGLNLAPGLNRTFDAEQWGALPKELWATAREEAHDLALYDRKLEIIGSDIDSEALKLAEQSARAAGLSKLISFRQAPVGSLKPPGEYGFVITNPPYGERIGEEEAVRDAYRELGTLSKEMPTWGYYVITAHEGFERLFGRRAEKNRKLYNGRIMCYYYQYPGPRRPRPAAPPNGSEEV